MFAIGKTTHDGGRYYVRSLSRLGDIKDNEFWHPRAETPRWIKTFKKRETAQATLEKMRGRGYDDYEVFAL